MAAQRSPQLAGATYSPLSKRLAAIDARLSAHSSTYTFLLAYTIANVVLFFFGAVAEYHRWPTDPLRAWCIGIARGFGYTLNLNASLILVLASKMTLSLLRETPLNAVLPFDHAMPLFHAMVGYTMLVTAVLHGIFHSVGGLPRGMWTISYIGGWRWCVVTGLVLISVFGAMVATACKPSRTKNFERFMHVHLFGAFLFFLILLGHGLYMEKLYTYKWTAGPVALYLIDRAYRWRSSSLGRVCVAPSSLKLQGGDIVRVVIPKAFPTFKAGQYAEIKIPAISTHQWHPFTIASAPHEAMMTFYIKAVGDDNSWTRQLHDLAANNGSAMDGVDADVEIHCRGPFGAPAQHVGQYDRVVLISGGVGATPFLSICKDIQHRISIMEQGSPTTIEEPMTESPTLPKQPSIATLCNDFEAIEFDDAGKSARILPQRYHTNLKHGDVKQRPRVWADTDNAHEKRTLEGAPGIESWGEFFSHAIYTVFGNTVILWIILVRFGFNLVALAFHDASLDRSGVGIFHSRALTCIDLALGFAHVLPLLFSLAVESVNRTFELLDACFLVPLSVAQIMFDIAALSGVASKGMFTYHSFVLIWPLHILFYLLRYFRILGRRVILVQSVRNSHRTTRSVDFCWTVPKRTDDDWLCGDLESTVARSRYVRLHRFLTRETPPDEEAGAEAMTAIPGFTNNYGRPNWDSLFHSLAEKSPNGATIGIFFCGNPAMGAAVKQAAQNAMIDSTARSLRVRSGLHVGSTGPADTMADDVDGGAYGNGSENLAAWRRSFNVRFIVRQEVF